MRIGRICARTIVAATLSLSFARSILAQANASFACPNAIVVVEKPQVPSGWLSIGGQKEHPFKTAKIYNGNPGREEYDLKPDRISRDGRLVTQIWRLDSYRDMNLFVRCFYYDTDSALMTNLPNVLKTCSVKLEVTPANRIVGRSGMVCR